MTKEAPQPNPEQNLVTNKDMALEMAYAEKPHRESEIYYRDNKHEQVMAEVMGDASRTPEFHAVEANKAGEAARQRYENPGQVEKPKEQEDQEWLSRHLNPQATKKRGQVALYGAPGGYVQGRIVS